MVSLVAIVVMIAASAVYRCRNARADNGRFVVKVGKRQTMSTAVASGVLLVLLAGSVIAMVWCGTSIVSVVRG